MKQSRPKGRSRKFDKRVTTTTSMGIDPEKVKEYNKVKTKRKAR